jgi:tetratricopeptide (TPR) repeat protein
LLILTGGGSGYTAQSQAKAESNIRSSFGTLKESLARGDRAAIIRQLSPDTMEMFSSARSFGLDPDSADLGDLSQLAVLIGFQARWLLGVDELATKSSADLFEWGAQNGIVQIGGLSTVDLANIRADGNTATAYMATGGRVMTNAVLSFALHGGRWTLEFDKILLASEPQLAALRAQRSMSKAELAVAMLEGMYKQPIPSLREFLLAPKVRKQVAALKNKPASGVYDAVIEDLSAGCQSDAEDILDVFVGIHTNDQRLAFAQAVCTRSRFSKLKAGWQFRHVLDMNPGTVEGNCARYMLDLDDRKRVTESFKGLRLLADENPNNPLLHWMIGVQCRDHFRHTDMTERSAEGAAAYARVLELFDVGPVLVHQTYANILSEELDRDEKALKHRRIAVTLEPKSWTYQGLANTLSAMRKYDEANVAYAKLVELDPDDAQYWHNWANSLSYQQKWDDCILKCRKALDIDAGYYKARNKWGYALEQQGKLREALQQYEETIKIHPVHPYAYEAAARVLTKLGEADRAQEFLQKKARINEQPTSND